MREIKFRAYDKKDNEMFYSNMYQDKTSMIFGLSNFLKECSDIEDTLMQYTGLKDKNGVEIYEGDIVRTTSNELTGKWKHKIYKIEFKEINCVAGAKYMGFDFQFNVDEVEIIGNIYENKELLK